MKISQSHAVYFAALRRAPAAAWKVVIVCLIVLASTGMSAGHATAHGVAELPAALWVGERIGLRMMADAAYPESVNPETGVDAFRLGDNWLSADESSAVDLSAVAVAYNSVNRQYLVVWSGDNPGGTLVEGEREIWGQRLAADGTRLGNQIRISDMGPDGGLNFSAIYPDVAFNPTNGEYLVVWSGDDNTAPLVDDESEIYGQRLVAATGVETGENDFRISDLGPDGNTNFSAGLPSVTYNPTAQEYLVVWRGEDDIPPLVQNEFEIFGQRLTATGVQAGSNDFRISSMGPDADTNYLATAPDVAFNPDLNQYLIVWQGNDAPSLGNEIYGQLLDGSAGAIGDDFRISDMGLDTEDFYNAFEPAIAYNTTNDEYLVVWWGDDNTAPLIDNEFEIFGQRLTAAGAHAGSNDFRISDMGPDGSTQFEVLMPDVSYNPVTNEYLVTWPGEDNILPLVVNEFEIFGQRLNAATGNIVGQNDFRISDMGPNGNSAYYGLRPAVVNNSLSGEFLVVWLGNDDAASILKREVFGQRLNASGAAVGINDFRISFTGVLFDVFLPFGFRR